MKFRHLVLGNLFRKKIRTALTIASFTVALFLFCALAIVQLAFQPTGINVQGADRLLVVNKVSVIIPMPVSYQARMARIPGVRGVTYATWFGGVYQDDQNSFAQYAVDTATWRPLFPEFNVAEDQWKAFVEDREAAFVGEQTAKRFNWKIGDRIPLKGTTYSGVWEFNIRGIYTGKSPEDDTSVFWMHWDLLNERIEDKNQKNLVGWYTVALNNPEDADRVIKAIDSEFANSGWETKSATEKAFASSFAQQLGNVKLMVLSIGAVVFFTLLLVTGNTIAIAVRERLRELAILKAIGYSDGFVLSLVVFESMTVAVIGSLVGLGLAELMVLHGDPTVGSLPYFYLSRGAAVTAIGLSLVTGVIASIVPAISAMRLKIVEALRRA
jgi:putative ABC transport system permease protein